MGFRGLSTLLRSTLARSSGASFLVIGVGSATSFVLQLLLARNLGAAEYGTYLIVLGWMNVATLFTKIDLDAVSVRFVSTYMATDEQGPLRGFLRWSSTVAWSLGVGVSVMAFAALSLFDFGLQPPVRSALEAACLLLPLTGALIVQSGALQGFKQVALSLATNQLMRPATMLLALGVIALLSLGRLSAAQAILLNFGASAIALFVGMRSVRAATERARAVAPERRWREWLRVALELLPITLAQLILSQQSDILVVGAMLSPSDAAHYGAATQLASLVAVPASAVLAVVLPRISELHVRDQRAELQALIKTSGRLTLLMAVIPAIGLALLAAPLLSLYGPSFREAALPMLLLIGAHAIGATVGAQAGNVMVMTGRQRPAAVAIGASALLNLLLAILLTRHFGAIGTAAATLTAVLVRSVALTWYLRRELKLNLLPLLW